MAREEPDGTPSAEDFFRGADGGTRVLHVWPDLLPATVVFVRCTQAVAGGMGMLWLGIPAAEVRAALVLTAVPRPDWRSVSTDVTAMGRIVAEWHNRRASRK